jgi:hypothetical protein
MVVSTKMTVLRTSPPAFVPTKQPENSPAFQRRGAGARSSVPQGRLIGRRIVSTIANDLILKTSVVPAGLGIILR